MTITVFPTDPVSVLVVWQLVAPVAALAGIGLPALLGRPLSERATTRLVGTAFTTGFIAALVTLAAIASQDFAAHVVHLGRPGKGVLLRPGMFFTIEPMINLGKPEVKLLDDGWTAVTRDRSLSAQFEHSIGITEDGCEIFTASPMGLTAPPYAG